MQTQRFHDILIGDLSLPQGGPMPIGSGHASHQTGLDVDIWYRPAPQRELTSNERETLPAVSVVREDGQGVYDRTWTSAHFHLLKTAASFREVERIFVNPAIKQQLCATVGADRAWLRKIRPWYGHSAHFHVRLRCPEGNDSCVNQSPPPPGDGCGAELTAWFTQRARQRSAPVPDRPALSDLPTQCQAILTGSSQAAASRNATQSTQLEMTARQIAP